MASQKTNNKAKKQDTKKKKPSKSKTKSETNTKKQTGKTTDKDHTKWLEVKLILGFFVGVILILVTLGFNLGILGDFIGSVLTGLFSISSYVIPYFIIFYVVFSSFSRYSDRRKHLKLSLVFLFIAQSIAVGLKTSVNAVGAFYTLDGLKTAYLNGNQFMGAGVVGNVLYEISSIGIGKIGSVILIIIFSLLFMTFAFGFKFSDLLHKTQKVATEGGKELKKTAESKLQEKRETKLFEETLRREVENIRSEVESEFNLDDKEHNINKKDFRFVADEQIEQPNQDVIVEAPVSDEGFKFIDVPNAESDDIMDNEFYVNDEEKICFEDAIYVQNENKNQILHSTEDEKETIGTTDADIKITEFEKDEEDLKSEATVSREDAVHITEVANTRISDEYELPDTSLLIKPSGDTSKDNKKDILVKARLLEDTFKMFKIDAKVVEAKRGPMITRFEVQPSPGVKISKISALSDEIAMNLAATNVRILAPIPGKAAVGIEVPNKSTSIVRLREVLESEEYTEKTSPIRFGLGKSISGKDICADLSKMPHLLIAGATGSGKSVCVNTIIASILFNARPDEVKFLMIDPKVVELSIYNGIPHLILPVVTDANKAANALNWAVVEMNARYKHFAELGVRDISGYNKKAETLSGLKPMPRIVVIIDELADLMIVAKKKVEDLIARITQMARAAGIHLIVATQRPSVDVITGVIKSNIPSRIAFAVSSYIDSRTIIDEQGAEKLLGKGDMLFLNAGESRPIRVQGSFITDAEVESLVEFTRSQPPVEEETEEVDISLDSVSMSFSDAEEEDELLISAIEFVISQEKASTSMVQRRFKIGYNRAARLIDEMEARGIIGESRGSKPREVLIDDIGSLGI